MSKVNKTRTQLVVETLREKILSGELHAGESLRQTALANELGVSRIPVREALLQLEGEGLVVFEAHKGATVSPLNAEHVTELFELRAMLEGHLLAASLPLLTEAKLTEAEEILQELEKAFAKENAVTLWSDLNWRYHNCLYSAANRPQTQELVNTLNKNADRYIRMHLLWAGGISKAGPEHNQLLAFCRTGDIDQAVTVLRRHILSSRDQIKSFLEQREESKGKLIK